MINLYKRNVIKRWFRIGDRKEVYKRLRKNWKINNIYVEIGLVNDIDLNDMFLWWLCRFWYVIFVIIKGYIIGKNKIK